MTQLSDQAQDILDFWFGELDADGQVSEAQRQLWFRKDSEFDRNIRQRFGTLLGPARDGQLDWQKTPRGRLALIILLDQFPRNMFRGSAASFAYDSAALRLALEGLAVGADQRCSLFERTFCYLPLEHSEELAHQEYSVALFNKLRLEAPGGLQQTFHSFYDYAVRHRDIIARFGRFPHRNAMLGRTSSAAELEFLEQPGSSF